MELKRAKVIMLSTNQKASKGQIYGLDGLHISNGEYCGEITQHLHIISETEKIKEGDYTIFLGIVRKVLIKKSLATSAVLEGCGLIFDINKLSKIIASTDPSFNLPTLSDSFISKYIKEYNSGNIIEDVLIEYEQNIYNCLTNQIILKINPKDNYITIRKVKDSWNYDEMKAAYSLGRSDLKDSQVQGKYIDNFKYWINQN